MTYHLANFLSRPIALFHMCCLGYDFTKFCSTLDQHTSPWTTSGRHADLAREADRLVEKSLKSLENAPPPSSGAKSLTSSSSSCKLGLGDSPVPAFHLDDGVDSAVVMRTSLSTSPVWCMTLQNTTVVLGRGDGSVEVSFSSRFRFFA